MKENKDLAAAWDTFCKQLQESGQVILRDSSPEDAFDQAEGYRYLTRLLRAGLESQIESSNTSFPRFFQLANETIKIGNDNPDNIYHNANLDGKLDYVISGKRGTVNYLSFGTKAGSYDTTGTMAPSGQLEASDLEIDENGYFEIVLSSTAKPGNWLPMTEDTCSVIVRQTFNDRGEETPASYDIRCITPARSDKLDVQDFIAQLHASTQFVQGTANIFANWMESYSSHINQLPYDDQNKCQQAGGDASIQYLQSYWKLAPDEALLIHAREVPDCKTWNFQLSNYWMESLDYRYHRISINQHSAHYESDGSVKVIVAHKDPGPNYKNWLETCGHTQGGMLWRWIEADTSREYPLDCQLIKMP